MQLSVIIVNYNVKFFLEQCLCSVEKAIQNIDAEVLVVDNASRDGSIEYLASKFSFAKFISNPENKGFAQANNVALALCTGKYVLFLNPDTIVPENCFEQCIAFLETHPEAGALGVKMVDGSGKFLPESKRSFPSPLTSLFKLMGLTSLFPKSKTFARYSLGHLSESETNEVDVLAGAFFMAPRELLQQLNGFDETFFMYGEDIDLSYRIQKSGYKNYYFSGSTIIHFKGESTKKGSLNYIRMFYNAMSIFVTKHYKGSSAWLFRIVIQIAIWLRAAVATIFKFLLRIGLPLVDAVIIYGSFEVVKYAWVKYARGGQEFGADLVNIALPGFTVVFLIAATLAGIYDRLYKPAKAFYSALVAILVMLAVYSLLPEKYRFSRGIILIGGMTALVMITCLRWFLLKWQVVEDEDESKRSQRTLIIGNAAEYENANQLLKDAGLQHRVLGRIAVDENKGGAVGSIAQLSSLIESIGAKELIFCEGTLSFQQIIDTIQQLPSNIRTKYFAAHSNSIVGSDSKDTSGESLTKEGLYNLSMPYQRRMKRIIDVTSSFFIILLFPISMAVCGAGVVANAFNVLSGRKTWVAYSAVQPGLPQIKTGVISTTGNAATSNIADVDGAKKIDFWYAKNYDWKRDLKLIFRHYKNLGE